MLVYEKTVYPSTRMIALEVYFVFVQEAACPRNALRAIAVPFHNRSSF